MKRFAVPITRYGIAATAGVLATAVTALFTALGLGRPLFPFYLAIAITGWLAGDAPAGVAVACSCEERAVFHRW